MSFARFRSEKNRVYFLIFALVKRDPWAEKKSKNTSQISGVLSLKKKLRNASYKNVCFL